VLALLGQVQVQVPVPVSDALALARASHRRAPVCCPPTGCETLHPLHQAQTGPVHCAPRPPRPSPGTERGPHSTRLYLHCRPCDPPSRRRRFASWCGYLALRLKPGRQRLFLSPFSSSSFSSPLLVAVGPSRNRGLSFSTSPSGGSSSITASHMSRNRS